VQELRNRLMVFYSVSAWARSRRDAVRGDIRDAATQLETSAEQLRVALQTLLLALAPSWEARSPDLAARAVPDTRMAVQTFVHNTEGAMDTLRRALVLCGIEGHELLADLEDALTRVTDAATLLRASLPPRPWIDP
jgi:hypothetical protein